VIVLASAIQASGQLMISLSIAFAIFCLEPELVVWLVQVAVENAAAIRDLASAVYLLSKASNVFRKNQNK
jgi:hypothetical protein